MEILAKTFAGLEEVLCKEIEEIGGKNVKIQTRSVSFEGDKKLLYASNYCLRTALKILVPILDFEFRDVDEFYKKIYNFDWTTIFDYKKYFAIEQVVSSAMFKNTQFAALKAKDAIVDFFMSKVNNRPSIDIKNPDIKLNLYINNNYCNISLDSSGEALYKRGYKVRQGPAPLNEVLAAGIIMLSGWDKKTELADFMCGSGTIPIEAALLALNIPPQFKRKIFGFQNWKDYDASLWKTVVNTEFNKQKMDKITIFASDISQQAIDVTSENVSYSGLSSFIKIKRAHFDTVTYNEPKFLLFNPPYGKRLGEDDEELYVFYKKIGDVLKNNHKGSTAWMITGNMTALKNLGLRTSKKIILYNGPIESRLVKYELF